MIVALLSYPISIVVARLLLNRAEAELDSPKLKPNSLEYAIAVLRFRQRQRSLVFLLLTFHLVTWHFVLWYSLSQST
jgi:hypothetical protein